MHIMVKGFLDKIVMIDNESILNVAKKSRIVMYAWMNINDLDITG